MLAREGDALLGEAIVVDADVVDSAVGRDSRPARHVHQVRPLQHDGCDALRPDIPAPFGLQGQQLSQGQARNFIRPYLLSKNGFRNGLQICEGQVKLGTVLPVARDSQRKSD